MSLDSIHPTVREEGERELEADIEEDHEAVVGEQVGHVSVRSGIRKALSLNLVNVDDGMRVDVPYLRYLSPL